MMIFSKRPFNFDHCFIAKNHEKTANAIPFQKKKKKKISRRMSFVLEDYTVSKFIVSFLHSKRYFVQPSAKNRHSGIPRGLNFLVRSFINSLFPKVKIAQDLYTYC